MWRVVCVGVGVCEREHKSVRTRESFGRWQTKYTIRNKTCIAQEILLNIL